MPRTSRSNALICFHRRSACRGTTTSATSMAGASAVTRSTSTRLCNTWPTCRATTWTGSGPGFSCFLCAGRGCGHHRRAGKHEGARRTARREGHPARGGSVGLRRGTRLAVVAATIRPPLAAILLIQSPHQVRGDVRLSRRTCGRRRRFDQSSRSPAAARDAAR